MLTITIDRGLEEPVYAQVAHQIRQLIASGSLVPGTTLPSVRRLAGDLGVNLNTIARAYRMLEEEGFLIIRGRSGAKVAAPAEEVEDSTHVQAGGRNEDHAGEVPAGRGDQRRTVGLCPAGVEGHGRQRNGDLTWVK